jgi:hypothetical protein
VKRKPIGVPKEVQREFEAALDKEAKEWEAAALKAFRQIDRESKTSVAKKKRTRKQSRKTTRKTTRKTHR